MMNESVTDIVSSVWQALFGLEVTPVVPPPPDPDAKELLSACIRISGAWSGAVVARVSFDLARRTSAIMLAQPLADTTIDDARDCLGELVNMFGGNLKALLPGPSWLSLPTVTAERPCAAEQHLTEVARVGLESDGAVFTVSVLAGTTEVLSASVEAQS
jgi:chemotaxis protein CheX